MGWSVPQASQLGLGGVDEYQNVQKQLKKQEALNFCLVEAFRRVQSYFQAVCKLQCELQSKNGHSFLIFCRKQTLKLAVRSPSPSFQKDMCDAQHPSHSLRCPPWQPLPDLAIFMKLQNQVCLFLSYVIPEGFVLQEGAWQSCCQALGEQEELIGARNRVVYMRRIEDASYEGLQRQGGSMLKALYLSY